jgi:hypothetical protein
VKTRNRADSGWSERGPRSDLPNVPPEVFGVCVAHVNVKLSHKSWSWVGRSEVSH